MFDKYEGENWQFHFVTITPSGEISIATQKGKYKFPAIDGNGKITGGKDNDNNDLEGDFSRQGPFDVIRLKRTTGGERHFRGINAFERPIGPTQRQIVLVGRRSRNSIPDEQVEGAEGKGVSPLDQQDEGVWIATKP